MSLFRPREVDNGTNYYANTAVSVKNSWRSFIPTSSICHPMVFLQDIVVEKKFNVDILVIIRGVTLSF